MRGSGTSANVFLQLFGAKGKTNQIALDSGKNNFNRGSTDVFGLEDVDVGEIQKIIIGHDNKVHPPSSPPLTSSSYLFLPLLISSNLLS